MEDIDCDCVSNLYRVAHESWEKKVKQSKLNFDKASKLYERLMITTNELLLEYLDNPTKGLKNTYKVVSKQIEQL